MNPGQEPLAVVFLAVIALASLMQAAFVGALAFGLRKGERKVAEVSQRFGTEVRPRLVQLAGAAGRAAALSSEAVLQARRMDAVVDRAATRMSVAVDRGSRRVERLVDTTGDRLAAGVRTRAGRTRVGRTLAQAAAFARGLERAMDVVSQLRGTNGDGSHAAMDPEGDGDAGPAAD